MSDPKATVLVIDDEAGVRSVLRRFLVAEGYAVVEAPDGRAALEFVHKGPIPDVIIVDLMMPVMTGFEVLSTLRVNAAWAEIPVIVLTATDGYSADHLRVAASLVKPFDLRDVKAAVEVALKPR